MKVSSCDLPKSVNAGAVRLFLLFLLLPFFIVHFLPREASPQGKPAPSIHSVEISGNRLVEESTIRYYLKTKQGERFSVTAVRDDIQKLYSLGFFDDIMVDVVDFEGRLKVVFILKEKPSIEEIVVQGAKKVSQEDIYKALTVKPNTIINKNQIHESQEKVKALYEEKGYYFARVDYEVQEREGRRVKVLFKINEGGKYKIREIAFEGNSHLSDRQLKKAMETKEGTFFRRITSFGKAGRLVKSKLETDTRRISSLYAKYGFIEVEVKEPAIMLSLEKEGIVITFPVVESNQYKVGKVLLAVDEEFPRDKLKEAFGLREGDIFNAPSVADRVRQLTDYYTERGYAFANVDPRVDRRPEENLVDVALQVEKGAKVDFGRVDIKGNERTRDKVIRRQLAIREGALYDSSRITKSRERLQRLEYFSEVGLASQKRPEENLVDLEITVKEKETGSFSGGGGFSSQQGLFAIGRLTQRNLFGKGWIISAEGTIGLNRTDVILSFTEPYFMDTKLSTTLEFIKRLEDFDTFNIDTRSSALVLGYPLSDRVSVSLGYGYEKNEITSLSLTSEARQLLGVQEGTFITSALLPSIAYSSVDRPLNPSKGLSVTFRNKLSLDSLGSDLDYYRGVVETRYYHPVPKTVLPLKTPPTLMLRNVLGFAEGFGGDQLPIYERFFLGGGRSLRGFSFRDVGPRDEFGRPLGGTSSFLASAEMSFHLATIMDVVFFVDAGNVYLEGDTLDITNLRYSAGPGLRANTPFGPISIFLGYKLDRKTGEKSTELHFDFGRGF